MNLNQLKPNFDVIIFMYGNIRLECQQKSVAFGEPQFQMIFESPLITRCRQSDVFAGNIQAESPLSCFNNKIQHVILHPSEDGRMVPQAVVQPQDSAHQHVMIKHSTFWEQEPNRIQSEVFAITEASLRNKTRTADIGPLFSN